MTVLFQYAFCQLSWSSHSSIIVSKPYSSGKEKEKRCREERRLKRKLVYYRRSLPPSLLIFLLHLSFSPASQQRSAELVWGDKSSHRNYIGKKCHRPWSSIIYLAQVLTKLQNSLICEQWYNTRGKIHCPWMF